MKKLGTLFAVLAMIGFSAPSFAQKDASASIEEQTGRSEASCSVVSNVSKSEAKKPAEGTRADKTVPTDVEQVHE